MRLSEEKSTIVFHGISKDDNKVLCFMHICATLVFITCYYYKKIKFWFFGLTLSFKNNSESGFGEQICKFYLMPKKMNKVFFAKSSVLK